MYNLEKKRNALFGIKKAETERISWHPFIIYTKIRSYLMLNIHSC